MSAAFDADETARMSRALHRAWLQLNPAIFGNAGESAAKSALAKAILEATGGGMCDEDELVAHAVARFRKS